MKKKITAIILLMIISFTFSCTVLAENEDKINTEEKVVEEKAGIYANSPYAILLDMNTSMVLYEKNADERVYPADLTKIMTAVLVLENCNLEELAGASETALSNVKAGDSKLGIIQKEKLSVRQLLYGMLLGSASDAAYVLAEKTSGSIEEFVLLMNKKAAKLGMNDTNFTNPTGEHDERHYTTARDMSRLAIHAMKINEFCEIVKCDSYSILPTEKSSSTRKVVNRNHFVSKLLRNDYYYKYSTGIKTGYSSQAKSCIAASAKKNNMSLIALVFSAETVDNVAQSFSDCINMFDYVFQNYCEQRIATENSIIAQTKIENTRRNKKLTLKAKTAFSVIRHKEEKELEITYKDIVKETVSAPVNENDVIGKREYFYNKVSLGQIDLVADKSYTLDPITYVVNKMIAFITSPWLFISLAVIIFVLIMAERRRRRILRKKRRDARRKRNQDMLRQMDMEQK